MVTIAEMRTALGEALGSKGMSKAQIDDLSNYILSFFGHNDRIVDNNLAPADRDVFYMLEEAGLLSTSLEEVTIQKGKIWRIHYWILRKERILELAHRKKDGKRGGEDVEKMYGGLSDEAWERKTEKPQE